VRGIAGASCALTCGTKSVGVTEKTKIATKKAFTVF
jgi:hypothetical protein